nr:hypothetical protein [Hyphomonas sp. Mor2]
MLFTRETSSDVYQQAFDRFMVEVGFYFGEVRDYFIDLSDAERGLALCAFIMFLIYLIVARARRKYNPGSIGRQFVGAVILVGMVLFVSDILFDATPGAYSDLFRL